MVNIFLGRNNGVWDLATADSTGTSASIFLGRGDGTFARESRSSLSRCNALPNLDGDMVSVTIISIN